MSKPIEMTLGSLRDICDMDGQKVRPGINEFLNMTENLSDDIWVRIDEVSIELLEDADSDELLEDEDSEDSEDSEETDAGNRQA